MDIADLEFDPNFDFDADSMEVLLEKGKTLIVAYKGTFKGRELFNVREIYEQDGVWKPGKGISMPADMAHEFLKAVTNYALNQSDVVYDHQTGQNVEVRSQDEVKAQVRNEN